MIVTSADRDPAGRIVAGHVAIGRTAIDGGWTVWPKGAQWDAAWREIAGRPVPSGAQIIQFRNDNQDAWLRDYQILTRWLADSMADEDLAGAYGRLAAVAEDSPLWFAIDSRHPSAEDRRILDATLTIARTYLTRRC
jgi:hypothetical protein